jgi:hypothetical protein
MATKNFTAYKSSTITPAMAEFGKGFASATSNKILNANSAFNGISTSQISVSSRKNGFAR